MAEDVLATLQLMPTNAINVSIADSAVGHSIELCLQFTVELIYIMKQGLGVKLCFRII